MLNVDLIRLAVSSLSMMKSSGKDRHEPYIRASSSRTYNSKNSDNAVNTDGTKPMSRILGYTIVIYVTNTQNTKFEHFSEEPPVAASGPMADYERRSFHSAGSMDNEE